MEELCWISPSRRHVQAEQLFVLMRAHEHPFGSEVGVSQLQVGLQAVGLRCSLDECRRLFRAMGVAKAKGRMGWMELPPVVLWLRTRFRLRCPLASWCKEWATFIPRSQVPSAALVIAGVSAT